MRIVSFFLDSQVVPKILRHVENKEARGSLDKRWPDSKSQNHESHHSEALSTGYAPRQYASCLRPKHYNVPRSALIARYGWRKLASPTCAPCTRSWLVLPERPNHPQDLIHRALHREVVHRGVLHNAVRVDYEERPQRQTLAALDAIRLSHAAANVSQ